VNWEEKTGLNKNQQNLMLGVVVVEVIEGNIIV